MLGIYVRTSKENAYNERESPIEQQIQAGIEFAKSRNLEYKIYEDKGISGAKFLDDDKDPFSLRPAFSELLDDIKKPFDKKGKIPASYKGEIIDSVWVWENSRLARNNSAATYIYKLFEKYNVKVYVKDRELNFTNSIDKFMLGILNLVAEYEKDLIIARTSRGFYEAVDSGKRAHAKFYGYKKLGRNKDKNYLWEPVETELKEIDFAYKEYLSGKTLRQISMKLWGKSDNPENQLHKTTKLARFLAHAEYTGYNLKMSGLEILHKFEEGQIPDLQELKDSNYWVKSIPYNQKLITIEDWITVRERLQLNKKIKKANEQYRASDKSIATGLVKCGICGMSYFYYEMHSTKKDGTKVSYPYYYHHKAMNNKLCSNKPKSLNIKNVDSILTTWFFYWLMVFDKTNEITAEEMQLKSIEIKKINESIKNKGKTIKEIKTQIENFNKALSESQNISTEVIIQLSTQIANREKQILEIKSEIANQEIQLQKLSLENERAENDLRFNSMHNLIESFRNGTMEDKRNLIIRILGNGSAQLNDQKITITKDNVRCVFPLMIDFTNFPEDIYQYFNNSPEELKKYIFMIKEKNSLNDFDNKTNSLLWRNVLKIMDYQITLTQISTSDSKDNLHNHFSALFNKINQK